MLHMHRMAMTLQTHDVRFITSGNMARILLREPIGLGPFIFSQSRGIDDSDPNPTLYPLVGSKTGVSGAV